MDVNIIKDMNHLFYFYYDKKYFLSLENVVKEIIYEQFIKLFL